MELDKSILESVTKANKKLGEFFYVLANEPSVGLYHVQEHIRKTIPKNTEIKREIRKKYQSIEAITYDINFSIQTVKSLHDLNTFIDIKSSMERCIEHINNMNKYARSSFPPLLFSASHSRFTGHNYQEVGKMDPLLPPQTLPSSTLPQTQTLPPPPPLPLTPLPSPTPPLLLPPHQC
jgi:hypothetical protein